MDSFGFRESLNTVVCFMAAFHSTKNPVRDCNRALVIAHNSQMEHPWASWTFAPVYRVMAWNILTRADTDRTDPWSMFEECRATFDNYNCDKPPFNHPSLKTNGSWIDWKAAIYDPICNVASGSADWSKVLEKYGYPPFASISEILEYKTDWYDGDVTGGVPKYRRPGFNAVTINDDDRIRWDERLIKILPIILASAHANSRHLVPHGLDTKYHVTAITGEKSAGVSTICRTIFDAPVVCDGIRATTWKCNTHVRQHIIEIPSNSPHPFLTAIHRLMWDFASDRIFVADAVHTMQYAKTHGAFEGLLGGNEYYSPDDQHHGFYSNRELVYTARVDGYPRETTVIVINKCDDVAWDPRHDRSHGTYDEYGCPTDDIVYDMPEAIKLLRDVPRPINDRHMVIAASVMPHIWHPSSMFDVDRFFHASIPFVRELSLEKLFIHKSLAIILAEKGISYTSTCKILNHNDAIRIHVNFLREVPRDISDAAIDRTCEIRDPRR